MNISTVGLDLAKNVFQVHPGDPERETRTVRSIDGIDDPVDLVVLAP